MAHLAYALTRNHSLSGQGAYYQFEINSVIILLFQMLQFARPSLWTN